MALERYEITREIGRGPFGVVFLARDRERDEPVALKRLPVRSRADAEHATRDAAIAADLRHPNIVRVHEVFVHDDCAYLAMEYVAGGSLRAMMGRLSGRDAARVLAQLLEALRYAHDLGVVHGNLKPENVLMDAEGRARITDFGASLISDEARTPAQSSESGTTIYVPPWGDADRADPAADLYAIGVLAREMLTDPRSWLQPPLAAEVALRAAVAQWAGAMVAASPTDRHADAAIASEALDRAVSGELGPGWRAAGGGRPVGVRPDRALPHPGIRDPARPPSGDVWLQRLHRSAGAGLAVEHTAGPGAVATPARDLPPAARAPAPPPAASAPSRIEERELDVDLPVGRDSPDAATERAPPPRVPAPEMSTRPRGAGASAEYLRRTAAGSILSRLASLVSSRRRLAATAVAFVGAIAAGAKLLDLFTIEVEREQVRDAVDCTVFAPAQVLPAESILVQVFAHLPLQDADVKALATEFDTAATRRVVKGLETEVARGTKLAFVLDIPGAEVAEPVQSLVWRGRPEAVQFSARAPERPLDGSLVATVTVLQSSVPIGHVKFKLAVGTEGFHTRPELIPVGDAASRYRRAFLSYAREDRAYAIRGAQMLRLAGIEYFQDILDLIPGEEWTPRLYAEIERSDLFVLFWSRAARDSVWVRREALHALKSKASHRDAPEIRPFIVEHPASEPWPEFAHLHFDDHHVYFVGADEPA